MIATQTMIACGKLYRQSYHRFPVGKPSWPKVSSRTKCSSLFLFPRQTKIWRIKASKALALTATAFLGLKEKIPKKPLRGFIYNLLFECQITVFGGVGVCVTVTKRARDPDKSFPHDSGEGVTDAVSHNIEWMLFSEINVKLLLSSQTVTDEGCYLGEICP